MGTQNVTLNLQPSPQVTVAVPVETLNVNPYAFDPANISWTMGTSGIATCTQNADGSANFTGVAVGSTAVYVKDSLTGAQSPAGILTVEELGGTFAISFTFGTPS